MCFAKAPKPPKRELPPPTPSRDDPESARRAREEQEKLRNRRGRVATAITGPLGDSTGYGANVVPSTVIGGVA